MDFSAVKNIVIPEGIVKSISAGGKTIWKKSRLPSGYTEISFIKGTGTQWIDTGLKIADVDRVEGEFSFSEFSTGNKNFYVFGARNTNNTAVGFAVYNYSHGGFTFYPLEWEIGTSISKDVKVKYSSTIKNGSQEFYVNDTEIYSNTKSLSNLRGDNTYGIFCLNGTTPDYFAEGSFYPHICYKGNNKVGEFIPAINDTTSEIGVYDLVSNTFLGNAGMGEFIAGEPVQR